MSKPNSLYGIIIKFLILSMTMTLHGLVTISELFAGFNFINTGVLNCLIMCQNARKMDHSEVKIQNFTEKGAQPPPQTHPHWEGGHPSPNHTPSAPAAPQ